ncbi:MAG: hypothetical protein IT214_05080 [Chitinophagaceae bacterium]|nr:hypothetical protein [Chitinophagaceae bacterium]
MKLYSSFLSIGVLLGCIYFSLSPEKIPSGVSGSSFSTSAWDNKENPIELFSFSSNLKGNKVELQWSVNGNEDVNRFEIEKSTDGKKFKTAALVFGTDSGESENYMFYEKATNKKVLYRIKIIDKKDNSFYTSAIEINPAPRNNNTSYQENL